MLTILARSLSKRDHGTETLRIAGLERAVALSEEVHEIEARLRRSIFQTLDSQTRRFISESRLGRFLRHSECQTVGRLRELF